MRDALLFTAPLWIGSALFSAACAGAAVRPTPEQQVVEDAAAALGGRERVLAVTTLSLEEEGTQGNLGQDTTPDATGQMFTVTIRREIDLAGGRMRIEQTRTPNFEYFQGRHPQTRIMGIDGDIGYDMRADRGAARVSREVARDRRADIYHHPLTIVRAALHPAATLTHASTTGHERAGAMTTEGGLAFTLAIDTVTKLPARVVSMRDHPVLGDAAVETVFDEYQDVQGLRLPARLTTNTDRFTTADLRVKTQIMDGPIGKVPAPGQLPAESVSDVPPVNIVVEEVARGVWLLRGQSHHSVLIEFSDHLVLFEAPSEARTLAIVAKARDLRPNKPLTHVINSHHHFDHSGGIRAAVSEGMTVITHEANTEFIRHLVGRPHTIAPDALTRNPKPLKLETVDGEMLLEDEGMTMRLSHIAGNPHGDALLMAYLPRQRLLVQADAYSPGDANVPGAGFQPYAANLLENIRKQRLRVDRIVPIHGSVVPFAALIEVGSPVLPHSAQEARGFVRSSF